MMNSIRLLILLTTLSTFVNAQTVRPKTKKNDAELQQRRAAAVSLLQSLAVEARSYNDEPLRARVQAQIADVLWSHDREAARTLFRRAWDVAEGLDQAATPTPVGPRPRNSRTQPRSNLRREILSLASRRDHALGEEFLAKLTPRDDSDPKTTVRELSATESTERLRLASELLEANNVARALQFADPALTRVDSSAVEFLVSLREKDALAADRRFASLLTIAGADAASDANTVSLLTSYAFTPSIYLVVSRGGIPSSNSYPRRDAPELHQQLRRTFFEVAAGILMRPLSQIDQSSAGRAGSHFIIMRLLPLFQQFAPDFVGPLNAQLASLGPEAARATANTGEVSLRRGMADGGESNDEELTERLDRAKNSDERDRAYAFAAIAAAEKAESRARELAEKIEDAETRKGVNTFVNYMLIRAVITQKRPDEALLLIRKTELPLTVRAHFLTRIATLKLKNDPVRATELLDEALTETRRLDPGTPERAYSLVAVLRQFSVLDRTRTWELMSEAVKTINSVPDFTGERGQTTLTLEGKFSIRLSVELDSPTDLTEALRQLAEQNFYQAMDVSKTLRADAPRALAMIAVARAVLIEQP
jgi:hypothetical protein